MVLAVFKAPHSDKESKVSFWKCHVFLSGQFSLGSIEKWYLKNKMKRCWILKTSGIALPFIVIYFVVKDDVIYLLVLTYFQSVQCVCVRVRVCVCVCVCVCAHSFFCIVTLELSSILCWLFLFCYIHFYWWWWLLLYSAILRSRADSLRSHVILHEWLAFYSALLNIHQSGVLTMLAWLVPYETAAVSAQVLCMPYNHAPCHFMQSHMCTV